MRTRLAALVAALALATATPCHPTSIATATATATADGVCPTGSNWDNAIHVCK